ncbi:MAG: hypothetical protein RIB47_05820 [Cyclobacteriaceae bacterium]
MTLEVFQTYDLLVQAKTLRDKGELIATRNHLGSAVNLFAMGGFYAEVFTVAHSKRILQIKVGLGHDVLNNYVESLRLSAE